MNVIGDMLNNYTIQIQHQIEIEHTRMSRRDLPRSNSAEEGAKRSESEEAFEKKQTRRAEPT